MLIKKIVNKIYSISIKHKCAKCGEMTRINCLSKLLGPKHIFIGNNTSIGEGTYLCAWEKFRNQTFSPSIIIGNNVSIGHHCHISACDKIEIGDGTLTGKWVTIIDNSHGECTLNEMMSMAPTTRPLYSKGRVSIGKNVWIGDKATILPGVTIGDGVIVGANSVVTKDIPPYKIAIGCPAKIINPKS